MVHRSASTRSNASSSTTATTASTVAAASSRGGTVQPRERQLSESSGNSLQLTSLEGGAAGGEEYESGDGEESDVCPRLKLSEVRDGKPDGGLTAVRLVCRNAANLLRRKDSTGSYLSPGTLVTL